MAVARNHLESEDGNRESGIGAPSVLDNRNPKRGDCPAVPDNRNPKRGDYPPLGARQL